MTYTPENIKKLHEQIKKIIDYINENVLTFITYSYSTPIIYGEHGKFTLDLNGPYHDQIRFSVFRDCALQDLPEKYPHHAVEVLKHWQEIKSYFHTEIKNTAETLKLINNFEI